MRKPSYPIYISKRNEHSYARYEMRFNKDSCLHNDVEDFLAKHNGRLDGLAKKLLEGHFSHSRSTDPEYPL